MNKDKLNSLIKYANQIKERMDSTTPEKHKSREESYRNFLKHELSIVTRQIEGMKLAGTK